MGSEDEATRYADNCRLFSTEPLPQFESVLRSSSPVCKLNGVGVDDAAMVCLAETLRTNTVIRELDLSNNSFGEAGAADLSSALSENRSLTSVKLRDNSIGDAGAGAICQAIADNPDSRVECLDYRSTGLTTGGLAKVMAAVTSSPTLTALNLESNGLTAEAGVAIGSALNKTTGLKVLCLGSNYLGDAGVVAVCRSLTSRSPAHPPSPLCLLDFSRNGVCMSGACAIADAIRSPACNLTELLLAYNPLSTAGCKAISTAVKERSSSTAPTGFPLRYLDVTGVDMGPDGEDALAEAVSAVVERLGSAVDATTLGTRSGIGMEDGNGAGSTFVVDGLDDRAGDWTAATTTTAGTVDDTLDGSVVTSISNSVVPSRPPHQSQPSPAMTATPATIGSTATAGNTTVLAGLGGGGGGGVGAGSGSGGVTDLQRRLAEQDAQIAHLTSLLQTGSEGGRRLSPVAMLAAKSSVTAGGASTAIRSMSPPKAPSLPSTAGPFGGHLSEPSSRPEDWGLHSTAVASSSAKRLKAVEDAVASLASEIRWVDEEGLKARLDAEEALRARIDQLASRLDSVEDAQGYPPASSGTPTRNKSRGGGGVGGGGGGGTGGGNSSGHRFAGGALSRLSGLAGANGGRRTDSNAPVPRELMARHVRTNEEAIVRLSADVNELKSQLSSVLEVLTALQARIDAVERSPADDAAVVKSLAERVNVAVNTMEERLAEATTALRAESEAVSASPALTSAVNDAVSSQMGAVSAKLREQVDNAVGVAMNTLQRTLDVSHGGAGSDMASVLKRLEVLEQTVTAEQEMSLTTLETIMRATQRAAPQSHPSSASMGMAPSHPASAATTPRSTMPMPMPMPMSSGRRMSGLASPHHSAAGAPPSSATGILSVSVAR